MTRKRKAIAAALADPRNKTVKDAAEAAGVHRVSVHRALQSAAVVAEVERRERNRGDKARSLTAVALTRALELAPFEVDAARAAQTAKIAQEIVRATPGEADNEAERRDLVRDIQHRRVLLAYQVLKHALSPGVDGETMLARLRGYLEVRGVIAPVGGA